ncbi:MAG: hypothetical protein ACLP1D_11745 [Xanthobacteraceae bacterium]
MDEQQIRQIVRAVFDEESDRQAKAVDDLAVRAVATILTSFGMNEDDKQELRADLIHLRRWRKSVEQAQGMTVKAVIVVIVSGFAGAVWLGLKTMLVKS